MALKSDCETLRSALLSLQSICSCRYAQWLNEDAANHDYRVIEAITPPDQEGYDIAHRTGIIGQVFRSEKSILARDVRNHPLYDPFDDSIDWELCFPVFVDGAIQGVINLEGGGVLEVDETLWTRISRVVEDSIGNRPPAFPPENNTCHLCATRRFKINTSPGEDAGSFILERARELARGGKTTLLVGHYPDLLQGRGPTITEANEQGLDVSYCFFGVEKRLDLLATGPRIDEALQECAAWWDHCEGRYEFILLRDRQ